MMGLLLSVLCALIGFMECQGNFLPEDHITSVRCNIPQLLRKLCLCKMFSIDSEADKAQNEEDAKALSLQQVRGWDTDVVVLDDEGKEKKKQAKKGCCASKVAAMSDGKFDEFLVYLMINLPFNFMIACYTIVGPSLIAKVDGELIRGDLAGAWQMGSPVAVEMVNLPTTFLVVLLVNNLLVSVEFIVFYFSPNFFPNHLFTSLLFFSYPLYFFYQ